MAIYIIEQMAPITNLYKDENGKPIRGRYVYARPNQRYSAMCKYPEGYSKSKMCYSLEEAVEFVERDYEKYKCGEYIDNDGRLITMVRRRPDLST
jgi:hypothetical protein